MKRLAATLALLALSGALVFPSAAAPFALTQSDAITQDVSLAPTTAPNGDYTYLDEDDELVVDLTATNPNLAGDAEGVNPDAVTVISGVFRVHYNGSQYAHVWITDESDAVTFVVDGEPVDSQSNNVTLGPNQSVAVGVVVDTTGEPPDGLIDDIEVNARVAEPESTTREASSTGDSGSSGGGTTVQLVAPSPTERSITVRNPGDDPVTVELDAMSLGDGDDVTLDEVDLTAAAGGVVSLGLCGVPPAADAEPGTTPGVEPLATVEVTEGDAGSVSAATLRFSASDDYLDTRGVDPAALTVFRTSDGTTTELPVRVVGERADGRVVFEADTPGFSTFTVAALRPAIRVSEAALSTTSLETNGTATVTARVANDGRVTGTRTVALTLDGERVGERTVTLDAGESTTVTFDVAPASAGEYAVAVDGVDAGTLAVEDDAPSTAGVADGTPAGEPTDADLASAAPVEEPAGLGLAEVGGLALLLALVVATLGLARRVSR